MAKCLPECRKYPQIWHPAPSLANQQELLVNLQTCVRTAVQLTVQLNSPTDSTLEPFSRCKCSIFSAMVFFIWTLCSSRTSCIPRSAVSVLPKALLKNWMNEISCDITEISVSSSVNKWIGPSQGTFLRTWSFTAAPSSKNISLLLAGDVWSKWLSCVTPQAVSINLIKGLN